MPGEYLRGYTESLPRGEQVVKNGSNAHVYVVSNAMTILGPLQQPRGTQIQEMRESSQNANSNNIYGNNQSYNFPNGQGRNQLPQANGTPALLARNHPPQMTSSKKSGSNGGIDVLRDRISKMIGLQQLQYLSANIGGAEYRPCVVVPQQGQVVIPNSTSFIPETNSAFKTPEVPIPVNSKTKESVKQVTAQTHHITAPKSPTPSGTLNKGWMDFIQSPRVPDRFDVEEDQEEARKFWVCDPDVYKKDQESRNMNEQHNLSSKNLLTPVVASNGIAKSPPIKVNVTKNQPNVTHSTHIASSNILKETPVSAVVSAMDGSNTVANRNMVNPQVATKPTSIVTTSACQKSAFAVPVAKNSRRKSKPRLCLQKGTQVTVNASKMRAGSKINGENLPSQPNLEQATELGGLDGGPMPNIVPLYSINPGLHGDLDGKSALTGASDSTSAIPQAKVASLSSAVNKNAKAPKKAHNISSYDESITRTIAKARDLADRQETGFDISFMISAGIAKRSNSTSPTAGFSRNSDILQDDMRCRSTETNTRPNTSRKNTRITEKCAIAKQPLPSPPFSLESWFSSKQTTSLDMHVVGNYPSPIVIYKKTPTLYETIPVTSSNQLSQQSAMKPNPLGHPEPMKTTSKPHETEFRIIYSKTLEIPRSSQAPTISNVVSSPIPLPQDRKQAAVKTPSSPAVSSSVWNVPQASSSTLQNQITQLERQPLQTGMSIRTASQQIGKKHTTISADYGKAASNIVDDDSVDKSLTCEPSCMKIPDEPRDYSMKTLRKLERDSQPCDIYQDVALDLSMTKGKSMTEAASSQPKTHVRNADSLRFEKHGVNHLPVTEIPIIADTIVNLPPPVSPAPIDTYNLQTLCSVALSAPYREASVESCRNNETETPTRKDRSSEIQCQRQSSQKGRHKAQKVVSQPIETPHSITNILECVEKNSVLTQNEPEIGSYLEVERKELTEGAVTKTEDIPLEMMKTGNDLEEIDRMHVEPLAESAKETIIIDFDGQSVTGSQDLDAATVTKSAKNDGMNVTDLSLSYLGIEVEEGSKDSIHERKLDEQISNEDDQQSFTTEEMTEEAKENDAPDVQSTATREDNLKVLSPTACEETLAMEVKSPSSVTCKSQSRVHLEATGVMNEEITGKQTVLAMDIGELELERSQNVEDEKCRAEDGIEQQAKVVTGKSQIEKSLCQKPSDNADDKSDTQEMNKSNEDEVVTMETNVIRETQQAVIHGAIVERISQSESHFEKNNEDEVVTVETNLVRETQQTVIHGETVERISQSETHIGKNVANDSDTNNEDVFYKDTFKMTAQKIALLDDISKGRNSPNVTLHRLNSDEMRNKFSVITENEIVNIRPESLNTIIKAKLEREIPSSDEDVKNKNVNPTEETEQDKSYPLKQDYESAEVLVKSINVSTAVAMDGSDYTPTGSADAAEKEPKISEYDTPEVVNRESSATNEGEISPDDSEIRVNDDEDVVLKGKCLIEKRKQESAPSQELRKECPPNTTTAGSPPKAPEKSANQDEKSFRNNCCKMGADEHAVASNKFEDQEHVKDEELKRDFRNESEELFFGIGSPSRKTFPHQRSFSENQELLEMDEACCDEYDNMFMTEDESGEEDDVIMAVSPNDSLNDIGTEKGNDENQQKEKVADSVEKTDDAQETKDVLAKKGGKNEAFRLRKASAVTNKVVKLDSVKYKLDHVTADEITEGHPIALPDNDDTDMGKNISELLQPHQERTLDDDKRVKLNYSSSFKAASPSITSPVLSRKRFGYGPNSTIRIGYNTHTDLSGCDSNIKRRKLVKKHETTSEPNIPKTSPKQSSLTYILLSDSSDSSNEPEGIFNTSQTRKKTKRASKASKTAPKLKFSFEDKSPMPLIKEEPLEIEACVKEITTDTELNQQIAHNASVDNCHHKLPSQNEVTTPTANGNIFRRTRKKKLPYSRKTVACSPKKSSSAIKQEEGSVQVHCQPKVYENVHTQPEVSENVHEKDSSLLLGKYTLPASSPGNHTLDHQTTSSQSLTISNKQRITSLSVKKNTDIPSDDSCDESATTSCCPLSIHRNATEVETPSFQSGLSPETSEDSDEPTPNTIRLKSFVRDPYKPDSDEFSEGGTIVSSILKNCSKSQRSFSNNVGGRKRRIPGSSGEAQNLNLSKTKPTFQIPPSKDTNTIPRKLKKFGIGHFISAPTTLTDANRSSDFGDDSLKEVVDEIIRKTQPEKIKSPVATKPNASRSKHLYTVIAKATKVSLSRPARAPFPNLTHFLKKINHPKKMQTARMKGKWKVTELNDVTKIKTQPLPYRQPALLSKVKREKSINLTMQKLLNMGLIVDQTPKRGNQSLKWISCSETTKTREEYNTTCRNPLTLSEKEMSFREPQMPTFISDQPVVTPKRDLVWFTKDDVELKPCYVALKRLDVLKY